MSESVKLNKAQADFIKMMTGKKDPQEAIDAIVEMMVQEELPRKHIMDLIKLCMKKYESRNK